ncbi:hypothetical protein [Alloactinosynnema sp. L-07]|uniref:hypothetical protein n=1 Tax=Alloactinosynnema sp. L-07 TaxID=1653480 RepID=UPI00065EF2D8|nr:hypothetical protein [Alloactinosynnema sp. L-07]CRK55226.1 hypothetical protein [Alloactinosynnema sp. L-07]
MITPLAIPTARVSPRPLPPSSLDLLVAASTREGRARHLRDLLTGADADGSVYLVNPKEVRAMLNHGIDPQLYLAYRDIIAPRPKTGQPLNGAAGTHAWFADLVVYTAANLNDSPELGRSLGHWNTPAQVEIFQCLSGRVLMLHTNIDDDGRSTMDYHVCRAGDHVVIPFGAWHLTVVLDAPAAVFNVYTDVADLLTGHTSREAVDSDLKYRVAPAPELTITRTASKIAVVGSERELTERPLRHGESPSWAEALLMPSGLAALYRHAPAAELARLEEHAAHFGHRPVPATAP